MAADKVIDKTRPIGRVPSTETLQSKMGFQEGLCKIPIASTLVIDDISILATIVAKPTVQTHCHPLAHLTLPVTRRQDQYHLAWHEVKPDHPT